MNIIWKASTRNHHVGHLNGEWVVSVVRPQKHRYDRTPCDWRIEVLGMDRFLRTFAQFDPRDLDSTKLAAEARTKFVIETLYKALQS